MVVRSETLVRRFNRRRFNRRLFARRRTSRSESRTPLGIETLESRRLLAVDFVVHISVDGLGGPYLEPLIREEATSGRGDYANYLRLTSEGSFTFNARTDFSHTTTLPNHTTMLTGRPVTTPDGASDSVSHQWTGNSDPPPGRTLHNNHPQVDYIASVFDVVHDEGGSTALFATKSKFSLFASSYNDHGAADVNPAGGDNGHQKIDSVSIHSNIDLVLDTMVAQFQENTQANYTFFHSLIPDAVGHSTGWGSETWVDWIRRTDQDLGRILDAIESSPTMRDNTVVILTTDHGGTGFSHVTPDVAESYTIPFFVWGPDVPGGQDLYTLYADSVADPGVTRPDYTVTPQPIRNGDSGNLAMKMLGLPSIPGSTIRSLVCHGDECDPEPTKPPTEPPARGDGPPRVTDTIINGGVGTPNRLDSIEFAFDKDVLQSLTADDLTIRRADTNRLITVPYSAKVVGEPRWQLDSLFLQPGFYKLSLKGTGVFDRDGVRLDGNGDGIAGDSWQDIVVVASPGDANADGLVDTRDYERLLAAGSFRSWENGDFNGNGRVDELDMEIWKKARFSDHRPPHLPSNRPPQSPLSRSPLSKGSPSRISSSEETPRIGHAQRPSVAAAQSRSQSKVQRRKPDSEPIERLMATTDRCRIHDLAIQSICPLDRQTPPPPDRARRLHRHSAKAWNSRSYGIDTLISQDSKIAIPFHY